MYFVSFHISSICCHKMKSMVKIVVDLSRKLKYRTQKPPVLYKDLDTSKRPKRFVRFKRKQNTVKTEGTLK